MRWGSAEQTLDRWARARPEARVLSVDVFDTVLRRRVGPDAVVVESVRRLCEATGLDASDVLAHRRAWRRRHDTAPTREREWRLAEWLDALALEVGRDSGVVRRAGLAAEARVERETTTPDPEVVSLVRVARRRGWRVVGISDTWHDREAVEALLAHHGVEVDRVFSSATSDASKRDGSLFVPVEAALGVTAAQVIHIGDNWKADLVRPLLAGWGARWRPRDGGPVIRGCADAPRRALAAGRSAHPDPLVRVGADLLAPLVLAHAVVARTREARSGAAVPVYLARDMAAFVDARRAIEARLGGPEPAYLRISRRAVSLAHPDDLLGGATGVAGRVGKGTVGGLMGGFDLDPALRADLLDVAGLTAESIWTDEARRGFAAACAARRDVLAAARDAQSRRLAGWVCRHVGDARRIAVYDTGWAGTAQDAIAASCAGLEHIDGVYLGVNGLGRPSTSRSSKIGLLWDDPAGCAPRSAWVRTAGCIRLVEVLLREPVPSVRRLVERPDGTVDVERTSGTDLTPAALDAAQRLASGVNRGVADRLDGVVAALRVDAAPDIGAWIDAVDRCFTRLLAAPPRAFARAMLALPYEEGGTVESTSSLDVDGWRHGTTWWPGVLAARGVGAAAWLAEPAAAVVARARQAKERAG